MIKYGTSKKPRDYPIKRRNQNQGWFSRGTYKDKNQQKYEVILYSKYPIKGVDILLFNLFISWTCFYFWSNLINSKFTNFSIRGSSVMDKHKWNIGVWRHASYTYKKLLIHWLYIHCQLSNIYILYFIYSVHDDYPQVKIVRIGKGASNNNKMGYVYHTEILKYYWTTLLSWIYNNPVDHWRGVELALSCAVSYICVLLHWKFLTVSIPNKNISGCFLWIIFPLFTVRIPNWRSASMARIRITFRLFSLPPFLLAPFFSFYLHILTTSSYQTLYARTKTPHHYIIITPHHIPFCPPSMKWYLSIMYVQVNDAIFWCLPFSLLSKSSLNW